MSFGQSQLNSIEYLKDVSEGNPLVIQFKPILMLHWLKDTLFPAIRIGFPNVRGRTKSKVEGKSVFLFAGFALWPSDTFYKATI